MSSSAPEAAVLLATQHGATRVLTLNRPEAGNALSGEVAAALEAALADCRADTALRAVVLTGAGERFFCTGGDVKRYSTIADPQSRDARFDRIRDLLDLIEAIDLPVLAAINGYAIGGGLELALACDLRFAAPGAALGFPQSRLGIIPGWNGIERVLKVAGRGAAMRLLLGGERVGAAEAQRLGVVDFVADGEPVIDAALRFANGLAATAPLSIGAVKRVVRKTLEGPQDAARALAREELARLWFSADHKEAEAAFAAKRAPVFTGR
jgi:enoyl-CoA hydratase/carnithine racemase